jgi:geranylgeranyl reductase family protein
VGALGESAVSGGRERADLIDLREFAPRGGRRLQRRACAAGWKEGRVLSDSYDVVVAGSGPAGAVAALVLARGGARVLMADPARFPRDKACGDVVGPRGVALLGELGVLAPGAMPAGDVVLMGPTWRRVRLPWPAGASYPSVALVVPRATLDAALHAAAVEAGADPCRARIADVAQGGGGVELRLSDGRRVRAAFAIGADGALSRVATAAGLLRPARALWGFALRAYVAGEVSAPHIVLWAPQGERPLPGYGWLFPGGTGRANLGLGVAVRDRRAKAALAGRLLPAFTAALEERGLLEPHTRLEGRRGGWLRMGLSGCLSASGRVLLVGDAAGLVNPLQGEGIAEAMISGRAAARAILDWPAEAAEIYRSRLGQAFGEFQASAGALHAAVVARPRLRTVAARTLTARVAGRATAPGWAVWWNDLLEGARPGIARTSAAVLAAAARVATLPSDGRAEVLAGLADRSG